MRKARTFSLIGQRRLALALTAMAAAPAVLAQQAQSLTVGFAPVATAAVPLSGWLTAAIALLLAVSALVLLPRSRLRGGRLFGWMLALVAGATLFAVTGQQIFSEAKAVLPLPAINLSVSPGTLDVAPFYPETPLSVTVTNATNQSVQIKAITLVPPDGPYTLSGAPVGLTALTPTPPTPLPTCVVTGVLPPNSACIVVLFLLDS